MNIPPIRSLVPVVLLALSLLPAASGEVTPLTLEDCVQTALAGNPAIRAAGQNAAAHSESVGESQAAYYPEVGVRAGVSRWQNHAFLPSGIAMPNLSTVIGPTDDYAAGGFGRYVLYDGAGRQAGVRTAKALEAASLHQLESVRTASAWAVHSSFYELAVAQELDRVARESLANVENHLAIARQRRDAGAATESDVLRAQVNVDQARADRVATLSRIRQAQGRLNVAMGRKPEEPLAIDPRPAAAPGVEAEPAGPLQALSRPEIRAAASAVEAARSQVESARATGGPKVYAEASYGWRDDSSALRDEAWSAGVSAEYPLFKGFAVRHRTAGAAAVLAGREWELQQAVLQVQQDEWVARTRLQEAREAVLAVETQVRDARESVRLMQERYKNGAVSITELLDAQTALTAAEARHVQSRWSQAQAAAYLRLALGTLLSP